MKRILILLALILLFISCQKREWGNPFDPNCPKEIWTPTDFIAIQEGTSVKISWSQPINQISGFKLQKEVDGESNISLPDQLNSVNQLIDNSLIGGKVHAYSLFAYAGDNVSNTVTFQITPRLTAEVTTINVSMITSNSVETGCFVTSDGGAPIIARGVCWSTKQNPTVADSKDSGTGTGIFKSTIIGLTPGMTYYIRAFATNSIGTSYGNQIITTTTAILPTITTTAASAVTATTATSGGNITSDGGAAVTARGVCWSTSQNPTTSNSKTSEGSGTGSFTSNITGLTPGAIYYFRAYATNSAGIAYGNQITTTTLAILPFLTTATISDITSNSAISGGNITNDGGAAITARGVCWSTTQNLTIANSKTTEGLGIGSFASSLTNLNTETTYYVRAYATNSGGTAYGNEISFTTTAAPLTMTDIDGNVYKTVTIGTQIWMAENLKTTKLIDGTIIPLVTDDRTWYELSTPAYCWYNNVEATFKNEYGALFNWYTIYTGKLCPTEWHIPKATEWKTLIDYLGGTNIAGGKLKEIGLGHWQNPNIGATNESGFNALPGGHRNVSFSSINYSTVFWSSTEYSISAAYHINLLYNYSSANTINADTKKDGYSVRCIKD